MRGVRGMGSKAWLALAGCIYLTGCASVVSGTTQTLTVTPVCEGVIRKASCELLNDKGRWSVQAPGAVAIQKSYADLAVSCTQAASTGNARFVSKPNGGVWGNALAGGLIGFAVDSASGAGYNYPDELPVVMAPPCAADSTESSTKKEKEK